MWLTPAMLVRVRSVVGGTLLEDARSFGTGWHASGATWQVWNRGEHCEFAVANAVWALVEILP